MKLYITILVSDKNTEFDMTPVEGQTSGQVVALRDNMDSESEDFEFDLAHMTKEVINAAKDQIVNENAGT